MTNLDTSCLMSDESQRSFNYTGSNSNSSLVDFSSNIQGISNGNRNEKEEQKLPFAPKQLDRLSKANSTTNPNSNLEKFHNVSLDDHRDDQTDVEEENDQHGVDDCNKTEGNMSFFSNNNMADLKVEVEFLRQQLAERDQTINSLQQQVQEGKKTASKLQSRLSIFLGGPNTKDDVSAHGKLTRVYKQLQAVEQERDDYCTKSVELSVSLADSKARVSTLESTLEEYQALVEASSADGGNNKAAWWKKFRGLQQRTNETEEEEEQHKNPVEPAKNAPPQVTFLRIDANANNSNQEENRDASESKPWSNRSIKSYFRSNSSSSSTPPERDTSTNLHDTGEDGDSPSGLKRRLGGRLPGLGGIMSRSSPPTKA